MKSSLIEENLFLSSKTFKNNEIKSNFEIEIIP
jgi:hypothetical protein